MIITKILCSLGQHKWKLTDHFMFDRSGAYFYCIRCSATTMYKVPKKNKKGRKSHYDDFGY